MATTTYRFVGDAPEVFPDYSSAFVVDGRQDDPNAEDFQQPGELRPGQEFEGPAGIEHIRIQRKARNGQFVPTFKGLSRSGDTKDEPDGSPPEGPPSVAPSEA